MLRLPALWLTALLLWGGPPAYAAGAARPRPEQAVVQASGSPGRVVPVALAACYSEALAAEASPAPAGLPAAPAGLATYFGWALVRVQPLTRLPRRRLVAGRVGLRARLLRACLSPQAP